MNPSPPLSLFRDRLALLALSPLAVYWLLCIAGVIQFHLWQQVVNLWQLNYDLVDLLGYAHGMRYTLVYLIFLASDWTGVSYDRLFSIIVPALLLAITWFSSLTVIALGAPLSRPRNAVLFAGISIFFIALSLFMNGRLMFAFTGASILMWSMLTWEHNHDATNFCAVVVAIYFSCVSSGTFLIVTFSFYFFLFVNVAIRNPAVCRRRILLTYALLLVVINPLLWMFVFKNLEFYGGGSAAIFSMLSHGYGMMLVRTNPFIVIPGLALAGFVFYHLRALLLRNWVLTSLVLIYLAGGMFGYSTALVVLLPLLVIASRSMLLVLDKVLDSKLGQVS